MREPKDIKEWLLKEIETIGRLASSCSSVTGAEILMGRTISLKNAIKFIDSDPPCKHPRKMLYNPLRFNLAQYELAPFCPDCGEKLKEKD